MPVFQYQPRSEESWNKRARGSLYEGFARDVFQTFSPKKENMIRILPPTWKNPGHYGHDVWIHYSVGPNNAAIVCPYKMKNESCPVCQAQSVAETNGNEKEAKEFKPTRRVLVWLIDRKEEAEKKEKTVPLLWAMPWTVDRDITKVCRDRATGSLFQIDHPDTGYDVYFDREQKGASSQNVEYTGFQVARSPSPVENRYLEYAVKNPVPDTLLWRSFKEIQALFEGTPPAEIETDAQPSAPPAIQSTAELTPPPVTAVAPPPPAPLPPPPVVVAPPPPPVQPFVSGWTGGNCSVCGSPQYTTPTGFTCAGGHANATPATNGQAAPPSPEPTKTTSRAAGLRDKFTTGKQA
jgi:hypothetical protein